MLIPFRGFPTIAWRSHPRNSLQSHRLISLAETLAASIYLDDEMSHGASFSHYAASESQFAIAYASLLHPRLRLVSLAESPHVTRIILPILESVNIQYSIRLVMLRQQVRS